MDRLLIVDNNEAYAQAVAEALGKLRITTSIVASGEDAIQAIRSLGDEIVAIMSDLNMPGMRGDELLGIVREIRPTVRRVLMSTAISDGVSDLELRTAVTAICSPDLILPKPVQLRRLREEMERLLATPKM